MVARASSGRRRGLDDEHTPLEASVPTNLDHRESRPKQCQGRCRHKGRDFSAGRIQRRNVRIQGPERGPWRHRGKHHPPSKGLVSMVQAKLERPASPRGEVLESGRGPRASGSSIAAKSTGAMAAGPGLTWSRWSHPVPIGPDGLDGHGGRGLVELVEGHGGRSR